MQSFNRYSAQLAWSQGATVAALFITFAAMPIARAQDRNDAPATVVVADYSFGYELTVPGGSWTYDRTRFSGPVDSGAVGVLRGRSLQERGTLQLLIYRLKPGEDFDAWIDGMQRQIVDEAKRAKSDPAAADTIRISHEPRKFGERRAAVISALDNPSNTYFQTYYYCVAFDDMRVWVLVFGGIINDAAGAGPVKVAFDRTANSLKILYSAERQAEIAAGLGRGLELLGRLKSAAAEISVDDETYYYEVLRGGAPGGYFTRRIGREVRSLDDPRSGGNVKEGLRVRERSWLFTKDGTARYSRIDLFSSSDLRSELIETRETEVTGGGAGAGRVVSTTDSAIREESKIISTFTSSLDQKLPDPREQAIGPNYLGLAWVRLLPALLGSDADELHAFAIYDATTRALVTYTVKSLGPRPLPGERNVQAFAYEVREAFAPQAAITYADERGVALRVEAGDMVFQRSDADAMKRKYGPQTDAARALMSANADGG